MGENQQPERVVQVGRAGCGQLSRRLTEVVGELIGVVGKIMVEIVQAVAQSVSESAGKVKPPEFACQRNRFFGSRRPQCDYGCGVLFFQQSKKIFLRLFRFARIVQIEYSVSVAVLPAVPFFQRQIKRVLRSQSGFGVCAAERQRCADSNDGLFLRPGLIQKQLPAAPEDGDKKDKRDQAAHGFNCPDKECFFCSFQSHDAAKRR